MQNELEYLGRVLESPQRPLGVVIGGAKVSDKMSVLRNLLPKIDVLVIAGGMANTFLKAQGLRVGDSLVEDGQLETARGVMSEARDRNVRLLLPSDVVLADRFAADAKVRTSPADAVPDGWRIMDAGPASVQSYAEALGACKTVVWNGPLGVFELPPFAHGSNALAQAIAALDAITIVGGGESAALVREAGLADRFDHVSTGGGAFLEFLEGRELPGVAALLDA